MNEDIRTLIDSLRRGQYEDPTEKIDLLSAALCEHGAELTLLVSLLHAPQIPLRLAALGACRGRFEPELLKELVGMAADPEARVRCKLAEAMSSIQANAGTDVLRTLAQDPEESVRIAAVKGTAGRSDCFGLQQKLLQTDRSWNVRLAAADALGSQKAPTAARVLLLAFGHDSDTDVWRRCAELLEQRLAQAHAATEKQLPTDIALLSKVEVRLKELGAESFSQLLKWITAHTTIEVDPQKLAQFGTDLTDVAENGSLPRAHVVGDQCDNLLKLLHREPRRSIALLGPAGSGKSALVHELVYLLAKPENGGWRVLRVSPTDFMAGTRYLGEWETRVRELIEAVRKPRRVIVYVPSLSDLSAAGTWSKSDSSIATALGPYIEDGSLLLLGESAPEEFERGLGRIPSLRRLFDRVLVAESSEAQTRQILSAVRDEAQAPITDEVLDRLQEVSSQFLNHIARPGNAVALLRAVVQSARESGRPAAFRDVLDSVTKSTGIPVNLLDDSIPLQHAETKAFFERRIMGQPEALDAVVDLVTLIKAGLTDPQKPFGVFLFVGPTGVGKTELARALAEFIFGDVARLNRFDMSEFATEHGFLRLIGGPNENGLLTDVVRQHPFSVVLLDEIEKSHVNVFDLCLQIFDAGRLTDGRGRTVDFRRTIVILTSNIGSTGPIARVGFTGPTGLAATDIDSDRTARELARFFRPEFLNRLDRIVHFRPLSLEVAEQIARREIDLVLQRSGIRRRGLAVEIDPEVVSLLVREGYSAHFGARPLKRTVERLLLLPLARTISSGSSAPRTLLHLAQREGHIVVTVTKPPAPPRSQEPDHEAQPLREQSEGLLASFGALERQIQPLADRKSELLQRTREPDFYQDAAIRTATFDEIHKLDQFLVLCAGLGKALSNLRERLEQPPAGPTDETLIRERLDQLGTELEQLRFVASCRNAEELGDVLLCLSLVHRRGTNQHGVEKLVGMYQGLAQRRRMTVEILGEAYDDKQDRAYLLVSGLGAFALLRQESGLHQIDHRFQEKAVRSGREVLREDRETVRVEAISMGPEPDSLFRRSVKARATTFRPARSRLLSKATLSIALFHEPSLRSLEFWATGPREDALNRGFLVLHAQITRTPSMEAGQPDLIIRHYDLGSAPRVKDLRTGRSTSRVDRVLKGHLETLLPGHPA